MLLKGRRLFSALLRSVPRYSSRTSWADSVRPFCTKSIVQNWQTRLGKDDILRRPAWRNERLASLSAWKNNVTKKSYSVPGEGENAWQKRRLPGGYGRNHTPSMSPHLPVTPQQVATAAIEAAEAGAALVHGMLVIRKRPT